MNLIKGVLFPIPYYTKRDVLRDLVPLYNLEKREKHPWKSDTFRKVAGYSIDVIHIFLIVQIVPNRAMHQNSNF